MTYIADIVLYLLIFSILFQKYLFYLGCKSKNCTLTHSKLKYILIINRVLSYILILSYVKLAYGSIFHSYLIYNILAAFFIAVGQYLNLMVYHKIGVDNVYYGLEYQVNNNKNVYLSEFPFNLHHPQYIGCIITLVGLFFLIGFNKNGSIRKGLFILMIFVSATYVFSIITESNCVIKTCKGK